MHNINSSNYEYDRQTGILSFKFDVGDLTINSGNMVYEVMKSFTIKYDTKEKHVINGNDTALLHTNFGTRLGYYIYQLFNFIRFKDEFKEYAETVLKKETSLDISDATNKLMDEIMKFHRDTVIDHYLVTGNKDAFEKLMMQ